MKLQSSSPPTRVAEEFRAAVDATGLLVIWRILLIGRVSQTIGVLEQDLYVSPKKKNMNKRIMIYETFWRQL